MTECRHATRPRRSHTVRITRRATIPRTLDLVIVVEEDINEFTTVANKIAFQFVRLLAPEFEEHDATGAQEAGCFLDDATKDLGPVRPAVEGQNGLEVESIARQEPQIGGGDVWHNADDDITTPADLARHGGKKISLVDLDVIGAHRGRREGRVP